MANWIYPTMKIGEAIKLAQRFPPDATLHWDGRDLYVHVKGEGYFDLNCKDEKLPWVTPPPTKEQLAEKRKRILRYAERVEEKYPYTAQRYRYEAVLIDSEIAKL